MKPHLTNHLAILTQANDDNLRELLISVGFADLPNAGPRKNGAAGPRRG